MQRGTPLYVGPMDGNEDLVPGTICTTSIAKPRTSKNPPSVNCVELVELQRRVNLKIDVDGAHSLPVSLAGGGTDPLATEQSYKQPIETLTFLPKEVEFTDIKRIGPRKGVYVPVGKETDLTPYLSIKKGPTKTEIKQPYVLKDVLEELTEFAANSCREGLTNEVVSNTAATPTDISELARLRYQHASFQWIKVQKAASVVRAQFPGLPTYGSVRSGFNLLGDVALAPAVAAAGTPTNAEQAYLHLVTGMGGHLNYIATHATEAAVANSFETIVVPRRKIYTDHVYDEIKGVRLEQSVYLKAVSAILLAIFSTSEGEKRMFSEWFPVREVHTGMNSRSQAMSVAVTDMPLMAEMISRYGGTTQATAPLDHLPIGAPLSTRTSRKFVRLMRGEEVTTYPPFAVEQPGMFLWAGHKIEPLVKDTKITHLAAEFCKENYVRLVIDFLDSMHDRIAATVKNCKVHHNNRVGAQEKLQTAVNADLLGEWMNDARRFTKVKSALVFLFDTAMNPSGRQKAEDILRGARHASEYLLNLANGIKSFGSAEFNFEANAELQSLTLASIGVIRRYIQHTRFCHYRLLLENSFHKPAEKAEWHRIVRFSSATVEQASKQDVDDARIGDHKSLHLTGLYFIDRNKNNPC